MKSGEWLALREVCWVVCLQIKIRKNPQDLGKKIQSVAKRREKVCVGGLMGNILKLEVDSNLECLGTARSRMIEFLR